VFSINTFIEVQVVGALLLLALSPIALLMLRKHDAAEGFCPPLGGCRRTVRTRCFS
jgi:hypothetical protein